MPQIVFINRGAKVAHMNSSSVHVSSVAHRLRNRNRGRRRLPIVVAIIWQSIIWEKGRSSICRRHAWGSGDADLRPAQIDMIEQNSLRNSFWTIEYNLVSPWLSGIRIAQADDILNHASNAEKLLEILQ